MTTESTIAIVIAALKAWAASWTKRRKAYFAAKQKKEGNK